MRNIFKTKSRAELIEEKALSIVDDIFITKFTYEEIAVIVSMIKPKALLKLEQRQHELDKQQLEVTNAIHSL